MPIGDRTDLKYLTFVELDSQGKKTKVYSVWGRGTDIHLGYIKFRPQWRCYVLHPAPETLFDFKCLTDVINFLGNQNRAWRASL